MPVGPVTRGRFWTFGACRVLCAVRGRGGRGRCGRVGGVRDRTRVGRIRSGQSERAPAGSGRPARQAPAHQTMVRRSRPPGAPPNCRRRSAAGVARARVRGRAGARHPASPHMVRLPARLPARRPRWQEDAAVSTEPFVRTNGMPPYAGTGPGGTGPAGTGPGGAGLGGGRARDGDAHGCLDTGRRSAPGRAGPGNRPIGASPDSRWAQM